MNESDVSIETIQIEDDGTFPGNTFPIVLYRDALPLDKADPARSIEARFTENGWSGTWHNGIFDFHHYHATAHEALGCARGSVRAQLGGPNGVEVDLHEGDVVVLPAGTAHKNLGHSDDYLIIGAYPPGQSPDMQYGTNGERPDADRAIAAVELPDSDPVHGEYGPLVETWR